MVPRLSEFVSLEVKTQSPRVAVHSNHKLASRAIHDLNAVIVALKHSGASGAQFAAYVGVTGGGLRVLRQF
jgi:hypothetical protein